MHAQIDIGIYFVPTNEGAVLQTGLQAGQQGVKYRFPREATVFALLPGQPLAGHAGVRG